MVDVRLEPGGDEATVRSGQDLGPDHQLDEGPERGALEHADRLAAAAHSAFDTVEQDLERRNRLRGGLGFRGRWRSR